MRLMLIAIVLALFKCNYGQEDTTMNQLNTDENIQATTQMPENRDAMGGAGGGGGNGGGGGGGEGAGGAERSEPMAAPGSPVPLGPVSETPCSSCAAVPDDTSLTSKISNVSRFGENTF